MIVPTHYNLAISNGVEFFFFPLDKLSRNAYLEEVGHY